MRTLKQFTMILLTILSLVNSLTSGLIIQISKTNPTINLKILNGYYDMEGLCYKDVCCSSDSCIYGPKSYVNSNNKKQDIKQMLRKNESLLDLKLNCFSNIKEFFNWLADHNGYFLIEEDSKNVMILKCLASTTGRCLDVINVNGYECIIVNVTEDSDIKEFWYY